MGGYSAVFPNNKNFQTLAGNLQKNLHDASSRSDKSTTPHADSKTEVDGYEVEAMIFMAYSLYKMAFERIRSSDEVVGK